MLSNFNFHANTKFTLTRGHKIYFIKLKLQQTFQSIGPGQYVDELYQYQSSHVAFIVYAFHDVTQLSVLAGI